MFKSRQTYLDDALKHHYSITDSKVSQAVSNIFSIKNVEYITDQFKWQDSDINSELFWEDIHSPRGCDLDYEPLVQAWLPEHVDVSMEDLGYPGRKLSLWQAMQSYPLRPVNLAHIEI